MFFKLVQLLMVCAIFNPFCCCTAGVLTAGEPDTAPETLGCCQSSRIFPSESPTETGDDHDPEACPHKALKEYQATSLKEASNAYFSAEQIPQLLTVVAIIHFEPVAHITQRIQLATVSQAPPPALSVKYCVYRI